MCAFCSTRSTVVPAARISLITRKISLTNIDAPTVELDRAVRRPEETGDHPQGRRLARAVRPEERDNAALGDLETDAVQRADAPVVGLDVVHQEEWTSPARHRRPRAQIRQGKPR